MNRIYQGRVTSVQISNTDPTTKAITPWMPLAPDSKLAREQGEAALWDHHVLFQDAVNYYIVALASLGFSPNSKLTRLRELLTPVWESFDKKGNRRKGMGESLQRAWQLEKPPMLNEAVAKFRQPLQEHNVDPSEMELAGESLAQDLGGDGSIQQGGSEYWPYFCQSGFKRGVTFPRSADQLAKENAQSQMGHWVWSAKSDADVTRLSETLKQAHFCNLVPGATPLSFDKSKTLIIEALEALHASKHVSTEQKLRWVGSLEQKVPTIATYAGGSINKDALKKRFYGFIVFKYLSSDQEGLNVLKSIYEKPATKQPKVSAEPTEAERIEIRLRSLNDDPIKLIRDKAQIVFRAFTALPIWKYEASGQELYERSAFGKEIASGELHPVAWKDFDIAAFKEALKVYNQFQGNLEKREAKLDGLATKLLVMDGERAIEAYMADTEMDRKLRSRLARIWKETAGTPKLPAGENGEESVVARFVGDPRIDRLRQIVNADLAEEYRLTDGRVTPYGLRRRTMKGWGEVKRRWQTHVRASTKFSEEAQSKLKAELNELRGGEKREQIGSHRLFEALMADKAAWSIWREPDDKLTEAISYNGWASDPLDAFREYCETRETFEEVSARPLNFTPADARYSRRLFTFTEACSFGKDRGEYRHDTKELAVTVPVALKDECGQYSLQPCRLLYSAPRLLRDGIRGKDRSYVQDWTQPMMRALFGNSPEAANPQKLKEAAVQLMPDYDSKDRRRILLNFPLNLDETYLQDCLGRAALWQKQFHRWKKGAQLPFLRWPTEFDGKEPHHWWEQVDSFNVLAADLGTRHAASVASVEASRDKHTTSRSIGQADGRHWYARYRLGVILRLPGENAQVLRPRSRLDRDNGDLAFREELYGERGRLASDKECQHTLEFLRELKQIDLINDATDLGALRRRFSFPEQNDKLLIALRRAQNWIATCVSWHWKLTQPDSEEQEGSALAQIAEYDRIPEWKPMADGNDANTIKLRDALRDHIIKQREIAQRRLLELTRRILPLRTRAWEWVVHPDKTDCRLLRQTAIGTSDNDVLLSGQRGLAIARIEQLSELRRRWQSLNQSLRRKLGQKPLTASEMRNDPIPDPCPDILRKLENIREQRVNQTAHLILAQALGLKLRQPQIAPAARRAFDLHGEYEAVRSPVDMIVLEDLSRYLSEQGRAKSENTRLMKWCHRAVAQKVKMLAEPFGIPVLETPAAYSSRFCSLTGMVGFRAAEIGWNDRYVFRWRVLLDEVKRMRAQNKMPSENAAHAAALFAELEEISRSDRPHLTLLAPQPGGPIFVAAQAAPHPGSASGRKTENSVFVQPMQADINAAINLALRAIASPDRPNIHHRLRTERKKGAKNQPDAFLAREPRRFGKEKVAIVIREGDALPKERNTNLFYDEYCVAQFGRARLQIDDNSSYPYASGPGLWKVVNDRLAQWSRCREINAARLDKWRRDRPVPGQPEL